MERAINGTPTNERKLEEGKKRVEDAIRQARMEVSLLVASLYEEGRVDTLPDTDRVLTIAQGWTLRRLFRTWEFEGYRFEAKGRATLREHEYEQNTTILVNNGRIKAYIDNKTHMITQENSLFVPSGVKMSLLPLTNTSGLKIFSPPITEIDG